MAHVSDKSGMYRLLSAEKCGPCVCHSWDILFSVSGETWPMFMPKLGCLVYCQRRYVAHVSAMVGTSCLLSADNCGPCFCKSWDVLFTVSGEMWPMFLPKLGCLICCQRINMPHVSAIVGTSCLLSADKYATRVCHSWDILFTVSG